MVWKEVMLLETTLTPFEKQKVIENAIWKGNNYSIFKGKGRNTSFPIGQQWSLYKHLNGTLMIDGALEEDVRPLKLELQRVVSCDVGAGNRTQILWKSNQCSKTVSISPTPGLLPL